LSYISSVNKIGIQNMKMDTATDNGNSEISKQRLFSFVAEIHSSKKTLYIVRNIKQCGFTVFVYISSVNKIGIQNMNVIFEHRSGQQFVIGKGLLDYHRVSQPCTLKTTF
jgi:hypothetical protein